jgi:hypothetical protein
MFCGVAVPAYKNKGEIMSIDLSDVKTGDGVFSIQHENIKVVTIEDETAYPILLIDCQSYTLDGKYDSGDVHPTLFHSVEEAKQYWKAVFKKLTKKPKRKYRLTPRNADFPCNWLRRDAEAKMNNGRHISSKPGTVSGLFGWCDQPEGHDYWEGIDDLFTLKVEGK